MRIGVLRAMLALPYEWALDPAQLAAPAANAELTDLFVWSGNASLDIADINQLKVGELLKEIKQQQLAGVATFLYPRQLIGSLLRGAVAPVRGCPVQEGLYATTAARSAVRRALAEGPWQVAVVQMVRSAWAAEILLREAPGIPILFDAIDAMGLHFQHSLGDYPLWLRPLVRLEAARCRRREQWLVARASLTTAVAGRDLKALGCPPARSRVVPVAGREIARSVPETRSQPPIVLLSGNLGYRPTVRGALWFAREVWPRLRRAVPGVRWVLAGARPPRVMRRLAELDGVEVHGDVDDLGPFLARASVAIAPMSTGSGVPMKVLEAWAAGLPVVAAPWAAAGLQESSKEGLLQAETADEWLSAITRLLTEPSLAEQVAGQGRSIWDRWYRPERVHEQVQEAIVAA
jgi:glycosyltransferase involved in cell wall biosynthesis